MKKISTVLSLLGIILIIGSSLVGMYADTRTMISDPNNIPEIFEISQIVANERAFTESLLSIKSILMALGIVLTVMSLIVLITLIVKGGKNEK